MILDTPQPNEPHPTEQALREQIRFTTISAEVSLALTESLALPSVLEHCAESVRRNMNAGLVRIWTLSETEPGGEREEAADPVASSPIMVPSTAATGAPPAQVGVPVSASVTLIPGPEAAD